MAVEDAEAPAIPEAPSPPAALSDGSPPNEEKSEPDDVLEEEESWEAKRQKIALNVNVEWLDFEHFKNRYSEKEGLAIIEVLVGHSQIAQEVSREMSKRSRGKKDFRTPTPIPKLAVDGDSYWMHRIRIQSPQLILLLSRLTGHRDKFHTERPRTFFAPFRAFHYCLPQMKQGLEILRAKWAVDKVGEPSAPPESPTSPTEQESKPRFERLDVGSKTSATDGHVDDDVSDVASNADLDDAAPDLSGDVLDSRITLAHLETFVDFVETHIEPAWQRAAGTSQRKFRFVDLWMAFQPGELLYAPLTSDSPQSSETGKGAGAKAETGQRSGVRADIGQRSSTKMYQKGWRLYTMGQDAIHDDKLNDTQKASKREFDLHVYYMEYDGNSYVPVRHTFSVMDYEGERDITTLEVYPMRFAKDADKIKKELEDQGTWFREAVARNHLSYDGWTLTHSPTGAASDSSKPPALEHIDSDVIIDFVEGYKSESSLAGLGPSSWTQGLTDFDDSDWSIGDDNVFILHWEPAPNSKKVQMFADIREVTQRGEWYVCP
jgi:hypothetical protein